MVRQSVKGVYLLHDKVMRVTTILQASVAGLLVLTGCKRDQVSSYEIPKEDYSISTPAAPAMAGHARQQAQPQLTWTLPKGWTEKSGQQKMGVGAFRVEGEEGKYADIRIIPLRAGPEIEQQSVNIWREELGLPEVPVDQIKGEEIDVPGAHAHLYDLKSEELKFAGKFKARTTGAAVEKDGTLWFVKMIGEESVVADQQGEFREFLKSLKFEAPETQVAGGSGGDSKNWPAPSSWKQKPASQMVLAAYSVSDSGKNADVSVTSFPGDVGGLFANVNRWRGQMALPAIQESELGNFTKEVTLADGTKATAVEISGAGKANYTLVVRRGGQTWFYKIIGDPAVVAAEKERLAEFAAKAK
jgi:hypothetical protein